MPRKNSAKPKTAKAGMHKMPGGMMMSDAQMKKMMKGGSKKRGY